MTEAEIRADERRKIVDMLEAERVHFLERGDPDHAGLLKIVIQLIEETGPDQVARGTH